MRPSLLALALLLLAPGARAAGCAGLFAGGATPVLVDLRLAQGVVLLCDDAFSAAASPVTRGALWSAEHLTAGSVAAARRIPREGEFHADDRLVPGQRAELEDYRGSGYDRGHLAPSGDMPTPQAQQQSFSLANMVPQASELNRGPWAAIEGAVRDMAEQRGELYVVTGPAFIGARVGSIGTDGVLVPTATWKAIYDPRAGTAAYVCSNFSRPVCQTVTVARLTQAVGIDPFPAVPTVVKARAMPLPDPGPGAYHPHARRPARQRTLLEQLLGLH